MTMNPILPLDPNASRPSRSPRYESGTWPRIIAALVSIAVWAALVMWAFMAMRPARAEAPDTSALPATVVQGFHLQAELGRPGSNIVAIGVCDADAVVTMYASFDPENGPERTTQTVAENNGTFTATLALPPNAFPGMYTVGVDCNGQSLGTQIYTVTLDPYHFAISPTSGPFGTLIWVAGLCEPNVEVVATLPLERGTPAQTRTQSDASGDFSMQLSAPGVGAVTSPVVRPIFVDCGSQPMGSKNFTITPTSASPVPMPVPGDPSFTG
jgi:hypothetical protein